MRDRFEDPYCSAVLRFIFKLLRALFIMGVGTALAAKFLLESNAEQDTEEVDLVSIFESKHLVSSADPFYGGKVFTMFGGALVDLREAQPAPTGIRLEIAVVMGGLTVVVPKGWRIVFDGDVYMGGWSDETKTTAENDTPRVIITGYVFLGRLQAITRSAVETAS